MPLETVYKLDVMMMPMGTIIVMVTKATTVAMIIPVMARLSRLSLLNIAIGLCRF